MKRLVAALVAALVVGIPGALSASGPAFATTDARPGAQGTSSETASAEADSAQPAVTISDAPAVLEAGQDLVVSVDVTNTGTAPLTLTSADLRAQATTAVSEFSVHRWMADVTPSWDVARTDISRSVAPGQTITLRLSFPDTELPWPTGEFTWGPRGIEIELSTDDGPVGFDRTMIVVASSAELTPFPATAVVPVSAISSEPINLLLDAPATDSDTDALLPDVTKQVDAWDIAGVTLAVDRELPVSTDRATLLALPAYDADISALSALDREQQARELATNTVFLPASSPTANDIAFAHDLGMTVLVPDADYAPADTLTYTPSAVTTFQGEPLLVTNSLASDVLSGELQVIGRDDVALDTLDTRQVAVALSAVHHRQRPNDPRPYVLAVPRGASDAARAAVAAVLDASWVTASSVKALIGLEPDDTERVLTEPDTEPSGVLTRGEVTAIDHALAAFSAVAAIFPDADAKVAAATTAAQELTSVSWRGNPSGREALIRTIAPTPAQLETIHVSTTSTINLISESSALPVQVTNGFHQPVTVTVHLDVPDIRLRAPSPVEVTLPGSSTTTVSVPVEAHGSGNLDVEVTVTNADGTVVGAKDVLRVRVRADWENVGTVVIAGAVGLVFLIGLVKSVRDGRRSKPVQPDDFVAASRRS